MNPASRDILRAVVALHVADKINVSAAHVRKVRYYERNHIVESFNTLYQMGMLLIVGLDEMDHPTVVPTTIGVMEVLA